MTYDFGSVKLLNSATYYNRSVAAKNWGYFNWDIGGAAELDPYDYFPQEGATDELRLSHADQGRWQWTVGGIYERFRDSDEFDHPGTYFGPADTPMADNGPYPCAQSDRSNSWSVFGDTSYKLLDALEVGAGVRSFRDRESSFNTYSANQTASFSSTDPRVYVRYQITPVIYTYVSAAKGFRPGSRPIRVITAEDHYRDDDMTPPAVHRKHFAFEHAWVRAQRKLLALSSNSKQILVKRSTHYVQFDKPKVVIDAILSELPRP